MHSARLSNARFRRQHLSTTSDDEFNSDSTSRPSTQDSKRSSCSRLSTDSGAGSLDDFHNRRNSSPEFWRDGNRRHTAPIRKLLSLEDEDSEDQIRPNTVWGGCSPRCSLSRYSPLPAIGTALGERSTKNKDLRRPFPVRRQCFMGPLDIDNSVCDNHEDDVQDLEDSPRPPVFSLTLDSDVDSDFDEETVNGHLCCPSDLEEDAADRPRKSLIRSATFTIEKEKPDLRGPFLTVAIRLPDSTRIEDRFESKELLGNVCEFALDKVDGPRPERYSLVTTDVPKRTFKDMTMTLREADIGDKTLMCLQYLNDSDDSE